VETRTADRTPGAVDDARSAPPRRAPDAAVARVRFAIATIAFPVSRAAVFQRAQNCARSG
jgi:hypothetical protein